MTKTNIRVVFDESGSNFVVLIKAGHYGRSMKVKSFDDHDKGFHYAIKLANAIDEECTIEVKSQPTRKRHRA